MFQFDICDVWRNGPNLVVAGVPLFSTTPNYKNTRSHMYTPRNTNRNPGRGFWLNSYKKCGEYVNFCKTCGDCGESGEKNSPHFTAFPTKIHRKIQRVSYKNSPNRLLWQINVRNVVKAVIALKKK